MRRSRVCLWRTRLRAERSASAARCGGARGEGPRRGRGRRASLVPRPGRGVAGAPPSRRLQGLSQERPARARPEEVAVSGRGAPRGPASRPRPRARSGGRRGGAKEGGRQDPLGPGEAGGAALGPGARRGSPSPASPRRPLALTFPLRRPGSRTGEPEEKSTLPHLPQEGARERLRNDPPALFLLETQERKEIGVVPGGAGDRGARGARGAHGGSGPGAARSRQASPGAAAGTGRTARLPQPGPAQPGFGGIVAAAGTSGHGGRSAGRAPVGAGGRWKREAQLETRP